MLKPGDLIAMLGLRGDTSVFLVLQVHPDQKDPSGKSDLILLMFEDGDVDLMNNSSLCSNEILLSSLAGENP